MSKKFWTMQMIRVTNKSGEEETAGEIRIYGYILENQWRGDEVTPKAFYDELSALGDVKSLSVRINSYGGNVSAGSAIYSLLKQHPAHVTVHVDGFALSAASVIAMAGDTVIMPGNAMMMIHNPSSVSRGDAGTMRREADLLDKVRDSMIAAYNAKTGIPRGELISLMDAETWFTADEAAAKGFADVVGAPLMAAACAKGGALAMNGQEFDLSKGYKNIPQPLKKIIESEGLDLTVKNNAPAERIVTPPQKPEPVTPAASPDTEAILAQGRKQGIEEERNRQKAIDELAVQGMESVINKAKYESGDSPEAVAMAIIKAQKEAGAKAFADRQKDAEGSGIGGVRAAVTGDGIGAGPAANEKAAALNAEIKKARGI